MCAAAAPRHSGRWIGTLTWHFCFSIFTRRARVHTPIQQQVISSQSPAFGQVLVMGSYLQKQKSLPLCQEISLHYLCQLLSPHTQFPKGFLCLVINHEEVRPRVSISKRPGQWRAVLTRCSPYRRGRSCRCRRCRWWRRSQTCTAPGIEPESSTSFRLYLYK